MALTASTMLSLGTQAPDFALENIDGAVVRLSDFFDRRAMLVMFICNHCPYVKHVWRELIRLGNDYQPKNVGIVAIMSNDAVNYPDDSPRNMQELGRELPFAYLYDATQEAAKAYRAACTPDFYVFDGRRKLVYRGQLDDSRPGSNVPVSGSDVRAALDAVLTGSAPATRQEPSLGCNIKWKPGNAPDYFTS